MCSLHGHKVYMAGFQDTLHTMCIYAMAMVNGSLAITLLVWK